MAKQYTLPDGRKVDASVQFQIGEQVYPGGWLATALPKELEQIGVTVEVLPEPEPEPQPDPPPPPPPWTKVQGLDFLKRLTLQEYTSIYLAADQALRAGNGQLQYWLDMVRVNGQVDVVGEDAMAAKAFLVGAGLLKADRAEIIFALPE